eukprot:3936958-Rhodomonas_salina.1
MLASLEAAFDAIKALQAFSLSNYMILREICDFLETNNQFDADHFFSEFVNTKRFVEDCDDGVFGATGQSSELNETLIQLFSEVRKRRKSSSMLGRIMALTPMRKLSRV